MMNKGPFWFKKSRTLLTLSKEGGGGEGVRACPNFCGVEFLVVAHICVYYHHKRLFLMGVPV